MTPLSLLLLFQTTDARLAAKASLNAPRLTYAEFGAWVAKASGEPVTVAPAIRDRKATVLVEDRPVRETMERFAETFLLEWERTPGGYTLRMPPKVRDEEARQVEEEARLADEALLKELDETVRLGRLSVDELDEESRGAEKALAAAKGTPEERAAQERSDRVMSMRNATGMHEAARILAGLSAGERQELLSGKRVYAAHPAISGMRTLEGDSFEPGQITMVLQPNPENHEVYVWRRSPTGGNGFSFNGYTPDERRAVAALPLSMRMRAWAKAEPSSLATPLAPAKRPIAQHAKAARSLADLLVSLHERSGLPIVADGFREAYEEVSVPEGQQRPGPDGKDVAGWLGSFRGVGLWPQPQVRTDGGWLLLRRPGYWRQLPMEVPEGPIRALEAAAVRKDGPTLEDYATFAGSLTPLQGRNVDANRLAMDAPDENLGQNVPFLRLWDALPSAFREAAERPGGVPLATLPPEAQELARACLEGSLNSLWDLDLLRYVLPGGPPLPADLRLTVRRFSAPSWAPFKTASGQIGTSAKALATYDLILVPLKT